VHSRSPARRTLPASQPLQLKDAYGLAILLPPSNLFATASDCRRRVHTRTRCTPARLSSRAETIWSSLAAASFLGMKGQRPTSPRAKHSSPPTTPPKPRPSSRTSRPSSRPPSSSSFSSSASSFSSSFSSSRHTKAANRQRTRRSRGPTGRVG
jgi:hypothetical protein